MSRPLFMFRPNLQNKDHQKAWEILQSVPEEKKSAFVVQAILETARKKELETTLRRVLREELKASPFPAHTAAGGNHSPGDDGVPGFPAGRRMNPT